MTELWADLVAAAVVGTERRAFTPPADGALGHLLGQIDPADREGALLGAAAALALYRRAGRLPPHDDAAPVAACDADDLPACSAPAGQRLATLLDGTQRALLPEWLAALARSGRRVPEALLPNLLELGRAQADLHTAILPVLGKRGRWLAAQNPDWSYAGYEFRALSFELKGEGGEVLPTALSAEWETGGRAARIALLREVRASAPAQARELLASTWASEKADDRTSFLETFAIDLSLDDEPLLEGSLDDRSKEVRHIAAGLLARLPESRLAQRMLDRVQPLLSWAAGEKPKLLGLRPGQPARIGVALPQVCDKAMIRDGVEPKPPANRQKIGERAWWLLQMLRAIPPDTWSRQWQVAPSELIARAGQGEWQALLQEGWMAATLAFPDPAWAEALLRAEPGYADLMSVLPADRQEALLLDILRGDCAPLHQHPVLGLLRQTRHNWSAALTRAVLGAVHRHMRKWTDSYDYQLRSALTDDFARRIPPAMLDEIASSWPDDAAARERWQGVIDRVLITLQFRRDMLREMLES